MKKTISILTVLMCNVLISQNIFPTSGNVGIGTTNPLSKLDVIGTARFRETDSSYYSELSSDSNNAYLRSWGVANSFLIYDILGKPLVMQPYFGNVGIGTSDPQTKLDVVGLGRFKVSDDKSGIGGLSIETNSGTNLRMGGNFNYSWIQSHMSLPLYINELGNNTIFNLVAGSVGIGTTNPMAKLQVNNGDNSYGTILATSSESEFSLYAKSLSTQPVYTEAFRLGLKYNSTEENGFISFYRGGSINGGFLGFSTNGVERLKIDVNGNVGIGSMNPQNKLDVNGTIHSKEVKVDMTGWSDFVFKKEYNLPTLEQVEKHIAEKGHLENIPSEKEVLENGINLGEMNAKLLQKIEELTLYIIEIKKENQKQNETQNEEIEKLKRIIKLKS